MLNRPDAPAELKTPTDLAAKDVKAITDALNAIVADAFVLYMKTKNFHWHMSGPHFRDYHLLLDEQAEQIYASIDPLAERVRKIGARTLTSIGSIAKLARIKDNDDTFVDPSQMLNELMNDNAACAKSMREAHDTCEDAKDFASSSLLETVLDATERRAWFLFEASQQSTGSKR